MTDTNKMPPDWVLLEAAKRAGLDHCDSKNLPLLRNKIANALPNTFTALCDMIAKYEKEPVDPKLECAREAVVETFSLKEVFAQEYLDGTNDNNSVVRTGILAIKLWEARKP